MARSESRVKTEIIPVRATPLEKTELHARAAQFGISAAELCRRLIWGAVPVSKTDQIAISELAATRGDLGRLGGLLKGWLAGSFSQGSPLPKTHAEVMALLRKIDFAQKAVIEAVSKVAGKS